MTADMSYSRYERQPIVRDRGFFVCPKQNEDLFMCGIVALPLGISVQLFQKRHFSLAVISNMLLLDFSPCLHGIAMMT